jgi:hypothetical protein
VPPGELCNVLVRFSGLSIAVVSIAFIAWVVLGPLGTLPLGIALMLFAGPISRGFYGR